MQKGKMRFIEVETKNRTADFINRLLTVWESSVRATHLFLSDSEIKKIKFTLAEHFRKKKLTKTNVKELLEGKETLVKGIKTKDRKSYNAVVKIGEKGYIDFIYV